MLLAGIKDFSSFKDLAKSSYKKMEGYSYVTVTFVTEDESMGHLHFTIR